MSVANFVFIESNTTGTGRLCLSRARARGFTPLFLSAQPDRYPFLAEHMVAARRVDTSDVDALCELLVGEGEGEIAAVMSTSEYFVETAARVAQRLGLPGPRPEAVRSCRDKARLAQLLAAAGVAAPATTLVSSSAELERLAPSQRFPAVIKPRFGSGSVDVRLVEHADELVRRGAALLNIQRDERGIPVPSDILIQDYLRGPEFSVEVFSLEGRHHVLGCTGKRLGAPPHFVELGHDFPAALEPETEAALHATALAALDAAGLSAGPSHIECRLDAKGRPAIIEINPRLAGGMIPRLIELATGVDPLLALIDFFSGRPPRLQGSRRRFAAIRFFAAERAGVIVDVHSPTSRPSPPGLEAEFVALAAKGDAVVVRGDYRDRLAYLIAASDERELLDRALPAMLEVPVVELCEREVRNEDGDGDGDGDAPGRLRKTLCPEALAIVRRLPPRSARMAELERLAAIDEAHLVMLVEAGILGAERAVPVLAEIARVRDDRYAELVDQQAPRGTYKLWERGLIARLGVELGGIVHTARSRNDINACLFKLELREWLRASFAALWRLRDALLGRASSSLTVLMPVYSQFQPGQPGTLGYYLWSLDAALQRDQGALAQLVTELDVCPLGAGAGAGTDFPIRAERTAELLGFARPARSALDAVASRDLGLRLLGALSVCSATLSRLAQDLQLWTMADVGLLELPDELSGGSSLMPQKRNPYLLEMVKGKLASLPSALSFALHATHKTPFCNAVEVGTEAVSGVADAVGTFVDCCALLRLMVAGLQPKGDRGEAAARRGAVVAAQVANGLVRERGLAFHEAHRLVGARIREALEAEDDPLAALASLSPDPIDGLDAAVARLRYGGGPGSVGERLPDSRRALQAAAEDFHRQSRAWDEAPRRRLSAVEELRRSVPPSGSQPPPGAQP